MIISRAVFKLEPADRERIISYLIESSYPGSHFFIMLIASAVIATVGLIIDSSAVIIGSMLVAPFLSPILSLSMGIVLADFALIKRSMAIVLKSILFTLGVAFVLSLFISVPEGYNKEIMSRSALSLPYLYVAIAAGAAASFSVTRHNLYELLVGVAISVSLLPPLATAGIGISEFDGLITSGSLQLFILNLIGIIFSAVIIFSLMGFYPQRKEAEKAMKVEEKKLVEEKAESEKA